MNFSFSFSKKAPANKVVKDSILRDDSTKDLEEELDYVHAVEGNLIKGSGTNDDTSGKKKELVIPLIAKNNWRSEYEQNQKRKVGDSTTYKGSSVAVVAEIEPKKRKLDEATPTTTADELTKQAVKELLDSVGEFANDGERKDISAIPLLFQNKVPDGFEEEDKMDVSLRPDSSTLDDYERIPIEEFGMAMLRGMGWKKEEGIGLTNKSYVELMEPQPRARGLGLGAERLSSSGQPVPPELPPNERKEKERELLKAQREKDKRKENNNDNHNQQQQQQNNHNYNNEKITSRDRDISRDRDRDRDRSREDRDRDYYSSSKSHSKKHHYSSSSSSRERERDRGYYHKRSRKYED